MRCIREISEKDYTEAVDFPTDFPAKKRTAARAVVFDESYNVALMHVKTEDRYKIPGGGIEEGEDIEASLKREVLEEAGCEIKVLDEIGMIIEKKAKFNFQQESYCYLASVIGKKGHNDLTEDEMKKGFELIWVSLERAKELFEHAKVQEDEFSESQRIRDHTFFLEGKKMIGKKFT